MRVWISKYALTKGIFEVDAEIYEERMATWKVNGRSNHAHGCDWHRTREAAVARALEMVSAKRKSLAKSLAKLEKLQWGLAKEVGHD